MKISPVAYIKDNLGVDLVGAKPNKPARPQYSGVLLKNVIEGKRYGVDLKLEHYLEKIYDAVVGFNHEQGGAFIGEQRLTVAELNQLAYHAELLVSCYSQPFEKNAFKKFSDAARMYKDLLEGKIRVIPRNHIGNRHTLVRADNGRIFEMLHSMTAKELARCSYYTNRLNKAVESAEENKSKKSLGRITYKVVLGQGAFGITRIARQLGGSSSNQGGYVAVKKTHPVLENGVLKEASKSNFYKLTPKQQQLLRKLDHVIITPKDSTELLSNNSVKFKGTHAAINKNISSHYQFSELGATTIQDFIKKFNVARYAFELQSKANVTAVNLMNGYVKRWPNSSISKDIANSKTDTLDILRASGIDNPLKNQKFLNTLAAKMLRALALLHENDLMHHDIKPDNIVLSIDSSGNVSAKFIDIDFIQSKKQQPKSPEDVNGCIPFLSPESMVLKGDDSYAYEAHKVDAYAMGLTLRHIAGYTLNEIYQLSQRQKWEAMAEQLAFKEFSKLNADEKVMFIAAGALIGTPLKPADNEVQDRYFLRAKDAKLGHALNLKDISDFMIDDSKTRYTPAGVLGTHLFNENNLMEDEEFNTYSKLIMSYGIVTDDVSESLVNGEVESEESKLIMPLVRAATRRNIAANHQTRNAFVRLEDADGLSDAERVIVTKQAAIEKKKSENRQSRRDTGNGLINAFASVGIGRRRDQARQSQLYTTPKLGK